MHVMNWPGGTDFGAFCDRFLQLRDRERSLDAARLVAGVDAGSRVVDVRVEKTGDDGASTEVDRARIRGERARFADAGDAAVSNRQRRANLPAAIDELAVREDEIASEPALCGAARGLLCYRRADGGGNRHGPCGGSLEQFSSREHLYLPGRV